MSAIPGGGTLSIEWVSRMQSLENDNNKLKKQLADIKSEMKATVAVDKELDKQRAEAAKAQERRNKAELNDINRLAKARDEHARKELTDIHALDIARIQHIDREKKGELASASRLRSQLLQEEQRQWSNIAATVRGGVSSAVAGLGFQCLTVAGIVATIKSGLDAASARAEKAAQDLKEGDAPKRDMLRNLPLESQASARESMRRIMTNEGIAPKEAERIVVSAHRSGKEDIIPFLGSLGDIGVDAPGALNAYRVTKNNFGNQRFKAFLNAALSAQDATGTPSAEIMAGMESISPNVGKGIDRNELMASLSVLGAKYTGPGEAATRLKGAINKLGRLRSRLQMPPGMENIGDLSLIEQLPGLEAGGFLLDEKGKPTTAAAVLGRGSAATLNTMRNIRESMPQIGQVRDRLSGSDADTGYAAIQRRRRFATDDPDLSAVDDSGRIAGENRAAMEARGRAKSLANDIITKIETDAVKRGDNPIVIALNDLIGSALLKFQGPESFVRDMRDKPAVQSDPGLLGRADDIIRALDRNTAALEFGGQRSGANPSVDR